MFALTIDLQDGFSGEPVVVRLDGNELAVLPRVKTRPELGFAERVEATVAAGKHTVTVERGATTATLELEITGPCFVGVQLRDGTPELRVQDHEFWYA
jgi:hypothetical protein